MSDASDLLELRALVDRYAIAVDRRDARALAELFVPGGGIDVHLAGRPEPVARLRGADGMERLLEALGVYADTFHLVGTFAAEVEEDAAAAVTYCVAHHLVADAEEPYDEKLYVVYDDGFARTEHGWRFTVRAVRRRWTERVPGAGQRPLRVDLEMAGPRDAPGRDRFPQSLR